MINELDFYGNNLYPKWIKIERKEETEIEIGLLVVKRIYKVVLVSHIMKVPIGKEQ